MNLNSGTAPKLSVIVPAFNEEATLAIVVEKLLAVPYLLEIIIVDDCSTDGTSAISEQLAAQHPQVRTIRHKRNSGKTAAVKTGIAATQGEIVIVQDADLEYDPAEIINVIQPILDGVADAVYGSRFLIRKAARVLYFYHYLANKGLTFFSNLLTNVNFSDVETGYKAFRGEIIRDMIIASSGFGFEIEVTAKLAKLGCATYEVPISYYGRTYEQGKKIAASDGIAAFWYVILYNWFTTLRGSFRTLSRGAGKTGTTGRSGGLAKPLSLVIVLALAGLAYIYLRPSQLHLTLEMAASSPSMAQLFWNVGKGFNEDDSSRLKVASKSLTSFDRLSFALPDRKLRGLRFDPLTNEGRVVIRHIEIDNFDSVLRVLPVSRVIPLHQIASRTERSTQQGDEVEFATTAGANDPGLTIILPKLLRFRWGLGRKDVAPLGIIYVGILASFLVVQNWLKIDRAFGLLSARISEGRFLNFDPFAVWVCAGLLALFCFACLLDLNGSSGGMHSSYGNGPGSELWVGSPQPVRVDEWSYVTPDILSQYFREDRFAVQDSALGDHNISLTGNIPVKHISTLFRPQFWSFFVLPPDYSFSVYWQAKALVLVGGIFIFLLWLTGSSAWGLAGALWYFFSPFTQWSYSWPSALPEMVGSLCLGIVCCSYLTVGRSWSWLAVSALGAAFSLINFAMCAYPPHLIPLAWVGVAMMVSWLVARRSEIFTTQGLWPRLAALLIAGLLVGGVGLHVYQDLKPAIAAVSDTIYPGRRVLPGGTLPVWKLASHYLPWTQNATNFPQSLGNICEGSGFLWLAPLTLLCVRRLALSPFQKAALIALWVCFAAIFCWCVFPMPAIFGHITALDRCTGARCLPALGLLNIAIVALTVTRVKQGDGIRHIYNVLLSTIMFTALLVLANHFLGRFFSTAAIVLGAFYLALLTTLIISAKPRMLAVLLIIPQALVFGGVNPVEQGMGEFTQSNFNRYIQSHRELLNGKWLVYSDMVPKSGFVAEAGCQVYTGTRYIPDIDHFKLFASRGLDINTFNRLGYLDAHAIAPGQPTRFIQTSPVVVEWDVAPTDPLLPQVGIRYLAFDSQPDPKLTEHLTALTEEPVDGFWLYKLPPATAAASSNPAH